MAIVLEIQSRVWMIAQHRACLLYMQLTRDPYPVPHLVP